MGRSRSKGESIHLVSQFGVVFERFMIGEEQQLFALLHVAFRCPSSSAGSHDVRSIRLMRQFLSALDAHALAREKLGRGCAV
eukprot:31798-Eustigmatos_ZCMA.PRE.1